MMPSGKGGSHGPSKRSADSPDKSKIDPMLKEILKTETPPRAAKRYSPYGAGTGAASATAHVISSPLGPETHVAQAMPPGIPQVAGAPAIGCSVEDLRAFVLHTFDGMGKDATALEVRIASRINQGDAAAAESLQRIQELERKVGLVGPLSDRVTETEKATAALEPLRKDVNVFAAVKSFVTQEQLAAKLQDIERFANNLDQHLAKLDALERDFKQHVEKNFLTVEQECQKIKKVIEGVYEGSTKGIEGNLTAVQIKVGQVGEELAHLKGMAEAEAVATRQELLEVKNEIGRVHAYTTQLKDSADHLTANSSYPKTELASLQQRLLALEARPPQGPQGDQGPQGHQGRPHDPWQGYHGPRAAPVRDPPGFPRAPPSTSGTLPQAARRAPVANAEFPDMQSHDLNRLFDDKVALSAGFGYDGEKHGETWKRKIRGYWISKCPDILPILNHVEDMDTEEITVEDLQTEANSYRWMTEINIKRISEILWGFLNTCLSGKARTCFEGADMCNGFDAWRRVVQQIHQGANVRLGTLRRLVKSPPQIAKLEDIDAGIVRFEGIMKDYRTAGGTPPEGAELKNDLLETLPHEIREQLMWRATEVHETFGQFVVHVRNTANSILFHRGKTTSSLNSVVESAGTEEENYEDAIMAVNRRFNRNGGGAAPRRQQTSGGDDRPPRALKCLNCGDEGHLAIKCPKPRVEVGQRPCFGCGKKGHIARNCPDKANSGGRGGNSKAVRNVGEPEKEEFFGCVDEEGFKKVGSRTRRPRPAARTLGSFMPSGPLKKNLGLTNSFSAMSCREPQCTDSTCVAAAKPASSATATRPAPKRIKTVAQIKQENEEFLNGLESITIEDGVIAPVFEEEAIEGEEVFAATEMRMSVAADTGAVAHCAGPKDLPDTSKVDQTHQRNLVDASGNRLKHFGRAKVRLRHANGKNTTNNFEVMNVCRPLHSVSMITDNEFDMLFTKTKGIVVPAGVFDEVIAMIKDRIVAEYPRKGGLYVTEVVVTDPDAKRPDDARPATFAGPGASR